MIILFVATLVVMTQAISRFEATVQIKMVVDFSYTIVSFFGLAIVLLTTFDQVPREVETKTIYLVLCRPVARRSFLIGKYVGVLLVLTLVMAILGALMVVVTKGGPTAETVMGLDAQLVQALYLLILKYASYASLLIMFTVLMSRPLAVVLSLLVYFYGHVSDFLHITIEGSDSPMVDWALRALDFVLPNYSVMDFPGGLIQRELFTASSLLVLTAYALSFAAVYLMIAVWAFGNREL